MFKVRPAKVSDAENLANLSWEMMQFHSQFDEIYRAKRNARKMAKEWFEKQPFSAREKLFVAEREGELIGYIDLAIRERESCYKIEKWGYIGDLYIQPAYRGKGLSRQLLDNAMKWFHKKDIHYVDLFVATNNQEAESLWKHYQFKEYFKKMYCRI